MTESAPDRFAAWLSTDLQPELSEHGFTKTGSIFHRRGPAGWGVINFQESQFGSRLETRFTINFGVALDRLTRARGGDTRKKPPEHQCPWRARLANAAGDRDDRRWGLEHDTDLTRLTAEVLPLLFDRGVRLIDERLSHAGFVHALKASPRVGHIAFFTGPQVIALLATPGPAT